MDIAAFLKSMKDLKTLLQNKKMDKHYEYIHIIEIYKLINHKEIMSKESKLQ